MKRFATIAFAAIGAWLLLAGPTLAAAPAAGPPYPDAVTGQRVYDYAGVFSPGAIYQAQKIIAGIEARTGAQVVVYSQVKPSSDNLDKANADALDLMNQWGVGRKGFDDGLVILFDMQDNLLHGQVSLYAGSGFRASFLTDSGRQEIFDNDMKPLLADGDLDGGLMAGLNDVDAAATPEHAAQLERGRQINAVIAATGVLLAAILILTALLYWLRHGRDPVYIDDSSILMPAPPAGLTPAMATVLITERTSDRTVTAGLVDLAARGSIAFEADTKPLGGTETGLKYLGAGSGALPAPEAALCKDVATHSENHDGHVEADSMYRLIPGFATFKDALETSAVKLGWLTAKPSNVVGTWRLIGGLEITAAIVVAAVWVFVGASGLFVVTLGLLVAGIASLILAGYMPARTRQGAMLWAMLAAYRRTLKLTLAGARSMGDVVKARALPWVTTPDAAMAWGVAFGLDREIEIVLSRSIAEAEQPGLAGQGHEPPWYPAWWLGGPITHSSGHGASGLVASTHAGGFSSGMFSASMIPDAGSIMSALGSIGSPSQPFTSSSGSGGFSSSSDFGGGDFGGGGGGGGGGAGGGF